MLPGLLLDDAETIGKVFCKITATEIWYKTTLYRLHRSQDTLESLYRTELTGKRRGIGTLLVVENRGDTPLPPRQHLKQLLELTVHRYQQR